MKRARGGKPPRHGPDQHDLIAEPDVRAILQGAVDEAARLLQADGSLIGLLDDAGNLRFAYESGISEPRVRRWRSTMEASASDGRGMIGTAIVTMRVLVTDDYSVDSSFEHSRRGDRMVAEIGIRSLVVAPLIIGRRSIGALAVYAGRPGAFGERDVALTRALADHAAVSIGNARLIARLAESETALARRVEIQRSLSTVGSQLATLRDPQAVLQAAVDAAARLLDADGALIDLVDPSTGTIRWAYDAGIADERHRDILRGLELHVGEGMFGRAIGQQTVVVTGDYLSDDRFVHAPGPDDFATQVGIRSMIVAPLIGDSGAYGVLGIYTARPDAYHDDAIALTRSFATQATIALTNARLIAELESSRTEVARRADAEQTLRELGARISGVRDTREIVQLAVDEAVRLLGADGARIDLIAEESGLLRSVYVSGERPTDEEWPDDPNETVDQGVGGRAVELGVPFRTGDYLADDRFAHGTSADHYVRLKGIRSALAAPLAGERGPFGAITVWSTRREAFGERDETLLLALATQASVALTNARLIEALATSRGEIERRADRERALREISVRITAIQNPGEVLQQVVDEATRLLGADGARIDLHDPLVDEIRWAYATAGIAAAEMKRRDRALRLGEGVAGRVIAEDRPFVTGDYLADDRFVRPTDAARSAQEFGVMSLVAVPLVGDAGAFGALSVISTRRDAFTERDVDVLEALALQAAIALANARLIEQLARSRTELARRIEAEQALREIAARISSLHDSHDILQRTVDAAKRLLGADGAILELIDPDDGRMLRWAHDAGVSGHFDPRYVNELTLPVGVGLTGRAVAERRVLIAGDDLAREFPPSTESDHFFATTGFRAMIAAPIVGEAGPLGAIEVYSTRPHSFDERDGELISALATQAAIAIANARLIDELASSQFELARRAETEHALREITARITGLRDPDEVLQRIVDEAKHLLGSDGAHLALMAEERTHLVPVVATGVDEETRSWMLGLEFPLHGGLNGLAAALGRPVRSDDYLVDPRIPHEPNDQYVAARLGIRGVAIVPLRAPAGEIIGTLAISYRTIREVDDEAIELLQVLADQAAIAVSNSRLDALLRESERRYRHLVENSPDLVWSIDEDARFTFLSDTCARLTGWRPDELIGGHFGGLVHPSSREVAEIDWLVGLQDGDNEVRGRVNLLHRDGHPIPAEFIAVSRIEDGRFIGANGSVRDMSERDRLERDLKASEERYRFLVQNSPDIVFSIDAEGRFAFVSETIERMTGFEPAELTGQHFSTIVTPDTLPLAAQRWEALVADPGTLQVVEIGLRRKDGRSVPVEVSTIGRTTPDGQFAGIHGSTRDVSERERLQRELRESEERWRYLVKASPDVVWAVDERGLFTFMGDRVTELTGWAPDDVVGRHFEVLTAPESMPAAMATFEAVQADPGGVYPLRIMMTRREGEPFPVEVWATGSVHAGKFVGAHGSIRDMTERERLEQDLRDSEARYRFLVDNSPDIIFSAAPDGKFTYVSESAERLLGWPRDEVAAGHFSKIVDPGSMEIVAERWAFAAQNPGVPISARLELLHRDGRKLPFEIRSRAYTHDGAFAGVHGSARDLSERDRLERDLRRQAVEIAASDERAHLARELHDSVTQALFSMTLLTRSVELLLTRDPGAALERLSTLRELQRDALAEMRALIFELRPGGLEHDGLVSALRRHATAVQGRIGLPVVVDADLDERLPSEVEDVLYRIAQEALHNVVKHASARTVRLGLTRLGPDVRLTVVDDGAGFDAASVPPGHLGLAGMRVRAEKLGGRFRVDSTPGRGTTIEVIAPVAAQAGQPVG